MWLKMMISVLDRVEIIVKQEGQNGPEALTWISFT